MFSMDRRVESDELQTLRTFVKLRAGGASPACVYRGVVHSDCAYTQRHLDNAFRKRPWWKTHSSQSECAAFEARMKAAGAAPAPIVLCVDEYENIDWNSVLQPPHLVTNSYCVRKGLNRKANLAKLLTKHASKCGEGCPLVTGLPETIVIDTMPVFVCRPAMIDFHTAMTEATIDADEAIEANPGSLWILKPSLTNKGAGIVIVRSLDDVVAALKASRDVGQWVFQRYVDRPLLLDRRKFHLRVYVCADGALRVHVFQEALVLLASMPYAVDDTENAFSHITNTCLNVGSAAFREEDCVKCTSELETWIHACEGTPVEITRARVASLWSDINACVAHSFAATYGEHSAFMPLNNAFELYGVDFLVDSHWKVRPC